MKSTFPIEKKKEIEVKKIVTHENPDLDSLGSAWLAKQFGKKKFPGIKEVAIEFLPGGLKMPDERQGDQWLEENNILVLDMGGGIFDHHQHPAEDNRRKLRCAATLMAEFLGIKENPALAEILRAIAQNDLYGHSTLLSLPRLIKDRNAIGKNPLDTFRVVSEWLNDIYEAQKKFVEAGNELKGNVKISQVSSDGKKIKIAKIQTDNKQAAKALRHKEKPDVIIVKNSKGNFQIFNNVVDNQSTTSLNETIKILRYEEQKKTDQITVTDSKILSQEGTVLGPGIELWHYIKNPKNGLEMLLNGSFSVQKPPTHLSEEEVMRAVLIGVDQQYFTPKCNQECSNCEFNPYDLKRCKTNS